MLQTGTRIIDDMDHLTHPTERIPLDDIPFFESSLHLYDGLGFEDFSSRVRTAQGGLLPQRNQASFIQGWLYFGLLREVFGQNIQLQDFIRPASLDSASITGSVISTAKLKEYIKRFDRLQGTVFDIVVKIATSENCRVHKLLRFTIDECNRLDYRTGPYDVHLPAILLSVQLLVQELQLLGVEYLPRRGRRLDLPWQCPRSLEAIRNHMLRQKNAWCPHQVQYLLKTFSYQALVYLAEMKRNVGPWFDHSRCSSETRCVGYNIDDKTFRGRHVDGCQGCSHIEAPLDDMFAILEDGGIPLLRCQRTTAAPDEISLSYEKLDPSSRYVAVSHVWSDGLGTPSKNSVPRCQLHRLVDRVREAESYRVKWRWPGHGRAQTGGASSPADDTLLWLDVYCVPASSRVERFARLKRAAIDRMVPTYALARLTLVIDHELQHLTPTNDDPLRAAIEEELLARVVISGWRTRCWTHQEHQVSRRVLIQCSGSFAAFDNNNVMAWCKPQSDLAYELSGVADRKLGRPNQTYRGGMFRDKNSIVIPQLGTVWNSFQGKSTSRPPDALYVFASIMRLSAKQIRHFPPENQIRAILRAAIDQEGGLPKGLFFSLAPRMSNSTKDDRDRWIPRFPGEGGTMETGDDLTKALPGGFMLSLSTYREGHLGCIGLKVPRPSAERFVVSLEESLVEVSLCVQEGLPQLQNLNYTEMLVVLQIPKAGAPFQGVGACFVPTSVSQFRFPSITTKLWVETIWYCPLSFRKLDDEGGFDGTDIEALIVPHEREVREVFICCAWQSWETPQILVGRGEAGMRFWLWFGIWGVPFAICDMVIVIALSDVAPGFAFVVFVLGALVAWNSFWWTSGLIQRAHWMLMIQSYSPGFDPKERWWRRLIKQLNTMPGQSGIDIFYLKSYAYWPWMLMTPGEWLWKLLVALGTVLRGKPRRIQLGEDVGLLERRHQEARQA